MAFIFNSILLSTINNNNLTIIKVIKMKTKRLAKHKFFVQVQEQDSDTGIVIRLYGVMDFYSRNKAIDKINYLLENGLKQSEVITNAKSWHYHQ